MREILFRGKDLRTGKWEYGFYNHDHNLRGEDLYLIQPVDETGHFTSLRFVTPETVGQYTGLKDKNGKKIFEGDIIRFPGFKINEEAFPETFALVEYEAKWGGWMMKFSEKDLLGDCLDAESAQECDVVGNIHDNPELLEVATDDA